MSEDDARAYMENNKTDVALALHDTTETLKMPEYIQEAVDGVGE